MLFLSLLLLMLLMRALQLERTNVLGSVNGRICVSRAPQTSARPRTKHSQGVSRRSAGKLGVTWGILTAQIQLWRTQPQCSYLRYRASLCMVWRCCVLVATGGGVFGVPLHMPGRQAAGRLGQAWRIRACSITVCEAYKLVRNLLQPNRLWMVPSWFFCYFLSHIWCGVHGKTASMVKKRAGTGSQNRQSHSAPQNRESQIVQNRKPELPETPDNKTHKSELNWNKVESQTIGSESTIRIATCQMFKATVAATWNLAIWIARFWFADAEPLRAGTLVRGTGSTTTLLSGTETGTVASNWTGAILENALPAIPSYTIHLQL